MIKTFQYRIYPTDKVLDMVRLKNFLENSKEFLENPEGVKSQNFSNEIHAVSMTCGTLEVFKQTSLASILGN